MIASVFRPLGGWTISVLCHLLGDDFGLLAGHRDGYYGRPGPGGAPEAEFVAWLDELQADWVRAARRLSPRIVADLLAWAGPQIAGTFRREDPRARTASVSWAAAGRVPAWLDQARELSEYWIHRQQTLKRTDPPYWADNSSVPIRTLTIQICHCAHPDLARRPLLGRRRGGQSRVGRGRARGPC